uniref:Ribosomal protein n=1 Tax=Biomphalaria glabrata TaxID=6526 RepID=A0A2C9L8A2_BIOGL
MDNKIEYDCYITTPSMIRSISSVAKILGPKGLMPSVKSGTVTEDFGSVIKDIKNGKKVEYKSDKIGGINMRIGSISFDVDKLSENLINAISYILSNKPDNVDKIEIKSAFLSSTMG